MKVSIKGKIVERDVDYYDANNRRKVPVIFKNEKILWVFAGHPVIVKTAD